MMKLFTEMTEFMIKRKIKIKKVKDLRLTFITFLNFLADEYSSESNSK